MPASLNVLMNVFINASGFDVKQTDTFTFVYKYIY